MGRELCYHIYGQCLRLMPFLAWLHDYDVCLSKLASFVRSKIYVSADMLFRVGQPNVMIHILRSGSVHISLNEKLSAMRPHPDIPIEPDEDNVAASAKHLSTRLSTNVAGGL